MSKTLESLTHIKRRSYAQSALKRFGRMSPRNRIVWFIGVPGVLLMGLTLWSAMFSPKIEAGISRNTEAVLSEYADPNFDLLRVLQVNPAMDRGNADEATNAAAAAHLQKHSALLRDLLSSYEADFLAVTVVPQLKAIALKEIENGPNTPGKATPTDKIGDINFQTCLDQGIRQEDCVYIRLAGDGIAKIRAAHTSKNVALYNEGRSQYLGALLALGDYSPREPDIAATLTTAMTYRKSIYEALYANRMWIGAGEEVAPVSPAPINSGGVERRIEKAQGR